MFGADDLLDLRDVNTGLQVAEVAVPIKIFLASCELRLTFFHRLDRFLQKRREVNLKTGKIHGDPGTGIQERNVVSDDDPAAGRSFWPDRMMDCEMETLMNPCDSMEPETGLPVDLSCFEVDLPSFLKESIEAMKEGQAKPQ